MTAVMAAGQPGSLCGSACDVTTTLTSVQLDKKPGAVSRPGTLPEFQFQK
jgi:hypothetical protein